MFKQDIARISVFKGLSVADLDILAPLTDVVCFKQNQVIFEQGHAADFLYVLLEGEVVVNFKPYDGPVLSIGRILPGGVFGWSAILGRQAYTSIAMAAVDCSAIRVKGDELRSLCEKNPRTGIDVLKGLAGGIAERLNSTHEQIFTMLARSMDLGVA